ncbi:hypothetical protein FOG17_11865 [Neisseria meningitidis]|nr:hypothetical protein [Neisseria meningitidis]
MLIGADCSAHTFPYVECRNNSAQLEHEATTSRCAKGKTARCRGPSRKPVRRLPGNTRAAFCAVIILSASSIPLR